MPIEIHRLTDKDTGRMVRYETPHGAIEYGRITSWNSRLIFVRYFERVENGKATPRVGDTSEGTVPEDLEFV